MALHLIPKPAPPVARKSRVKKVGAPPDMIQCPRCDGREVIVTLIGATRAGTRIKGGTQQVLCAGCLMRGERVVLA